MSTLPPSLNVTYQGLQIASAGSLDREIPRVDWAEEAALAENAIAAGVSKSTANFQTLTWTQEITNLEIGAPGVATVLINMATSQQVDPQGGVCPVGPPNTCIGGIPTNSMLLSCTAFSNNLTAVDATTGAPVPIPPTLRARPYAAASVTDIITAPNVKILNGSLTYAQGAFNGTSLPVLYQTPLPELTMFTPESARTPYLNIEIAYQASHILMSGTITIQMVVLQHDTNNPTNYFYTEDGVRSGGVASGPMTGIEAIPSQATPTAL